MGLGGLARVDVRFVAGRGRFGSTVEADQEGKVGFMRFETPTGTVERVDLEGEVERGLVG